MKKALLIIDVQNDYFPGGKCQLYKPELALDTIKNLLQEFRKRKLPIIYIQHESIQGTFFNPDTEGIKIHHDIEPLSKEIIVTKHYPNSFYKTDLQNKLVENEVTELVVCGMMTHMCVDTTVRAAKDYGYKVTLVSDACATKDLEWDNSTLSAEFVQKTYMASLNQKFAKIVLGSELCYHFKLRRLFKQYEKLDRYWAYVIIYIDKKRRIR